MTTLLILGATGATGRHALAAALAAPSISTVVEVGRKPSALPQDTPGLAKLSFTAVDFEKLAEGDVMEQRKLASVDADAVLIALGTTKAQAGSFDKFVRIDRDYVLSAAQAARVPSKPQRLVYISSAGASKGSFVPYSKSKGLTEEGLVKSGYGDTIIFRPGMLAVPGGREEGRLVESVVARFTNILSHVTSSIQIHTPVLGAALVNASILGTAGLAKRGLGSKEVLDAEHSLWSLGNAQAMQLGEVKL